MKPELQRIAIAESLGWKIENYGPPGYETLYWLLRQPDGTIRCEGCTGKEWSHLQFALMVPNFTGDLNAMHEAEKSLDDKIYSTASLGYFYAHLLYDMCGRDQEPLRATACQRAEAYLRTIGKWETQITTTND